MKLNILLSLVIISLLMEISFGQVTIVPSPNPSPNFNILRGISGTSLSNLWAVGSYDETGNVDFKNLMLKWNGSAWVQVTVPSPDSDGDLWAVSALNNNSVWAAGTYSGPGSLAQPQILKWNGSSWNLMSVPAATSGAFLWDIEAVSENNVWAAGGKGPDEQSFASVPYILRWDGSSWTRLFVPAVGQRRNRFVSIDYISSDNVWGVGSWGDVLGQYRFLIMHWDGNSWTHIQSPITNMNGELDEIQAVSPNDIWVVGGYTTGGAVYMHWDGNNWSVVQSPGSTGAIIPISSDNVFTVGSNVARWNGSNWSVIDNLSQIYGPALGSATLLPSGEIWAAGRYLDANNQLLTLTARFNGGVIAGNDPVNNIPNQTVLFQNYPNPFNPSSRIRFNISHELRHSRDVLLKVYDAAGKEVEILVNKTMHPGNYEVEWNASGFTSGVYFYSLSIDGNTIATKKMLLVK